MADEGVRILPRLPALRLLQLYDIGVAVIRSWRFASFIACLFLGLLAAGCGGAPPPPPANPAAEAAPYVIGPGDTLSVFVYRAPELSEPNLPVRPDGRISVPLIEDVQAAGKTPTQLARELEGRLKHYVKDPTVTVIVRSFVGPFDRQVRVIGEATEPTALPYREHMTVLDVMIATRGLTRYAAGNSSVIVRGEPPHQQRINVRLSDLIKDGDISQNVEMQPGDTLIIPQTWF